MKYVASLYCVSFLYTKNIYVFISDECLDYVKVYDVLSTGTKILKTLCGDALPLPIQSSSNKMLIKFHSDGLINNIGFKVSYHSVCKFSLSQKDVRGVYFYDYLHDLGMVSPMSVFGLQQLLRRFVVQHVFSIKS